MVGAGPARAGGSEAPSGSAEPDGELVRAVRAIARLSRALERSAGELSLAHYRVLAAVAEGHERASRVAEWLALGKPAVSASVEALCARGLLSRSEDSGDQRAVQLSVTPAGFLVLRQADAAMASKLEALAAVTGRRDEVLAVLAFLGAALDHRAVAGQVRGPVRSAT